MVRVQLIKGLLLSSLLIAHTENAAFGEPPFWTEKSQYEEGGRIYVVGIGSRKRSKEEARRGASDHAWSELVNYTQNPTLRRLKFNTKMTHEELHDDGTITAYRLMWVEKGELTKREPASVPSISGEAAKAPTRENPWIASFSLGVIGSNLREKELTYIAVTGAVEKRLFHTVGIQAGLTLKFGSGGAELPASSVGSSANQVTAIEGFVAVPVKLWRIMLGPEIGYSLSMHRFNSSTSSERVDVSQTFLGASVGYEGWFSTSTGWHVDFRWRSYSNSSSFTGNSTIGATFGGFVSF